MSASDDDDLFRAMADNTRRLILEELTDSSPQTLYELRTRLVMNHDVDMTRQGISKHLAVLEEAGLVASSMDGRCKVIEPTGTERVQAAANWLGHLGERTQGTARS